MSDFSLHSQLAADCIEIADLPLSKLLLLNDSQYPWFILVPRVADITEIYQLDWEAQQQLLNESSMVSEFIADYFNADKINVAALGNMVPQLHLHHIVRFKNDKAWPGPVWGAHPAVPYQEAELQELLNKLLPQLEVILSAN